MVKQWEEAYWILVLEEGDTPESVAAWMEQHTMKAMDEQGTLAPLAQGEVAYQDWVVNMRPGDVIVCCAPYPWKTTRSPLWALPINPSHDVPVLLPTPVKELPMSQEEREAMEQIGMRGWYNDDNIWLQFLDVV